MNFSRSIHAFTVLIACTLLLAACGGSRAPSGTDAAATAPAAYRDPAARGPYGVGITTAQFSRTLTSDGTTRTLDTMIWYPAADASRGDAQTDAAAASGGPFPIVVFSHGSGGEPDVQKYFTEHLASWGYVVAAPAHTGNTTRDCFPCDAQNVLASARVRPDDVTMVLDGVIAKGADASSPLRGIADAQRTAIAGHSFGGWTAVFVAPGGRFNAVIAMAPGLPETLLGRAPDDRVPTLLLAGGADEIVPRASVDKLWAALPAATPKHYVVMPAAHHLSFIDRCLGCTAALPDARGHDIINGYATAFLQTYLVGDDRYRAFLDQPQPPDAQVIAPIP